MTEPTEMDNVVIWNTPGMPPSARAGENYSPSEYAYVKAVLLYWEEAYGSEGHAEEAESLGSFFRDLGYETTMYRIPFEDSQLKVNHRIVEEHIILAHKIRDLGAPCLLIIYYTGNAIEFVDRHYTGPGSHRRRTEWKA
jgi:hypothetical protein